MVTSYKKVTNIKNHDSLVQMISQNTIQNYKPKIVSHHGTFPTYNKL